MGVKYFDEWIDKDRLVKSGPLEFLKGSVIGIDAAQFSKQFLVEPLLTALGGAPIALEGFENAVRGLRDAGIEPHFVFDGLHFNKRQDVLAVSDDLSAAAFLQYEHGDATHAKHTFQELTIRKLDEHMDTLKAVLYRMHVPFTVAPYSAIAQLAYFERQPRQFIDAVYGPTELFYFGVDKIITEFTDLGARNEANVKNVDPATNVGRAQFSWIDSSTCLRALGGITFQLFSDALILAGSDRFLETYPPLESKGGNTNPSPAVIIRDAVNILVTTRGNLSQPLLNFEASVRDSWLESYKQMMTVIKYHVVITINGDVECLEKEQAPVDSHDCIGLRLPEEIFSYLSCGVIGNRVLNWLIRSEITVQTPLAGADAHVNQHFVRSQMDPIRKQAVSILTAGLHRYYQRADFKTRFWFDLNGEERFKPADLNTIYRSIIDSWNVHDEILVHSKVRDTTLRSLSFAVSALADPAFAKRSLTTKSKHDNSLKSSSEVILNTIWRFLQLREFIDKDHQLTPWGRVLEACLIPLAGKRDLEESVFLAVELLRFGSLNTKPVLQDDFHGLQTANGLEEEKAACMLVSRVASLGRLQHKAKGYCGPLNRALLAYHSMIASLQNGLRDLLEMTLTLSLLDGGIDRERRDWMDLSLSLPFRDLFSCGLGVATLNYLDYVGQGDLRMPETQERTRKKVQEWIQHGDVDTSLNEAFLLWDAIYKGVRSADGLVEDREIWDRTNVWLSQRR